MTQPLDGTETARATHLRIVEMRDGIKAELARQVDAMEREIDAKGFGAPRFIRRRLARVRDRIRRQASLAERQVDAKFAEVTKGYDTETGVMEGVAEEAAAMLGDIFGKQDQD